MFILLGLFAADTLLLAYLWRLKNNRFEVLRDDAHAFRFRTDLGSFTIDRQERVLRFGHPEGEAVIPLERLERFDFAFSTTRAVWNEWIRGLDWWDLSRRYEDLMQWYRISVIDLDGGQPIPLFEVGQYLPREPLWSRVFDLQARILSSFGLFHDVEDRAHEVLGHIQAVFAGAGQPLTLSPMWATSRHKTGPRRQPGEK